MNILHVASFAGNIGDIANHYGFREWFTKLVGNDVFWKEFEIREVYRGQKSFDINFAKLANEADLVIIGGGNYFELWVDNSPTGTSISIEDDVFDSIKTPIFFHALGVDDGMGFTAQSIANFNRFLNKLLSSDQYLVSVRNDGAFNTLIKHTTLDPALNEVLSIPDGGFFTDHYFRSHASNKNFTSTYIGVNLASDMPEIRYSGSAEFINYEEYLQEIAIVLKEIHKKYESVKFILFPHIYSDIKIYSDLINVLPDELRRNNIIIEKYDSTNSFNKSIFNIYPKCEVILATRFHANVISLVSNTPTIGLFTYKQIESLYAEIGMEKYLIDARRKNFSQNVLPLLTSILIDKKNVLTDLNRMHDYIKKQKSESVYNVENWLTKNKLVN